MSWHQLAMCKPFGDAFHMHLCAAVCRPYPGQRALLRTFSGLRNALESGVGDVTLRCQYCHYMDARPLEHVTESFFICRHQHCGIATCLVCLQQVLESNGASEDAESELTGHAVCRRLTPVCLAVHQAVLLSSEYRLDRALLQAPRSETSPSEMPSAGVQYHAPSKCF